MNNRALIEAALFTSSEPLSVDYLSKLAGISKKEAKEILEKIYEEYKNENHGIELFNNDEKYEFNIKGEYLDYVSHLTPHADLGKGLLKVLSLVAFQQPITQSKIVKTIGNRTYDYIKDLEKRKLIKAKKYKRTKMLYTTKEFMNYFGIKNKKDMLKRFNKKGED